MRYVDANVAIVKLDTFAIKNFLAAEKNDVCKAVFFGGKATFPLFKLRGGKHGPKDKFGDLITRLDPCSIGFPTTGTKGASAVWS